MSDAFMIVGLGNPGPQYSETRHNAGFWFLEALAGDRFGGMSAQSRLNADVARGRLHGRDCIFVRPRTFMNRSGLPVRAALDYYRVAPQNLMVAYDELDLPPGTARLKEGGGHGGHNGLRDLFQHLPEHGFLRLRIGIGHPGHKDAVTGYVLSRPDAAQERAMRDSIERALEVMPKVLGGDLPGAMKDLHTEPSA